MKKIVFCFLLLLAPVFAEKIVLVNQTSYPAEDAQMVIQWASTGKDVDRGNQALKLGTELNQRTLITLKTAGKVRITLPQTAEYFRVLIWSNGQATPHLHTNWVNIVGDKSYVLKNDHLVPCALIQGSGC